MRIDSGSVLGKLKSSRKTERRRRHAFHVRDPSRRPRRGRALRDVRRRRRGGHLLRPPLRAGARLRRVHEEDGHPDQDAQRRRRADVRAPARRGRQDAGRPVADRGRRQPLERRTRRAPGGGDVGGGVEEHSGPPARPRGSLGGAHDAHADDRLQRTQGRLRRAVDLRSARRPEVEGPALPANLQLHLQSVAAGHHDPAARRAADRGDRARVGGQPADADQRRHRDHRRDRRRPVRRRPRQQLLPRAHPQEGPGHARRDLLGQPADDRNPRQRLRRRRHRARQEPGERRALPRVHERPRGAAAVRRREHGVSRQLEGRGQRDREGVGTVQARRHQHRGRGRVPGGGDPVGRPGRVQVDIGARVSGWTMAAAAIAAVVALPVLVVLASWRHPARDVWQHLWDTQLVLLLVNTLLLAAGVGVGTLVVGAGLAWLVVAYDFPGRRLFEWALVLPLAMPAYVIGFAFLAMFDFAGPVQSALRRVFGPGAGLPDLRSGWGVVAMMTLVFYPYVYVLARVAFREHGRAALEVARSLGHSPTRAFITVILPLARPALVAGAALAMMEALADFGTVSTFGYRTLTEAVYRVWTGMFDRAAATQVASLLLLLVLALLALERALRGRRRFTRAPRAAELPRRVLPAEQRARRGFAGLVGSTFVLAAASAALVGGLALVLAYARRLRPSRIASGAAQFASMGYALPGAVIAVGVLAPIAWLDRVLALAAEAVLGHRLGLVLTGSAAAVLFAYAVRFLAVGYQTTESALARIPPTLDEAARSLGVTMRGALRRVHLPLMRGGILSALTLIWVETIKELPATLLLRPFGLKTLAIEVWERTSESLWAEAALPALAIVGVGLVPLLLGSRLDAGRR